jgi:hypothetical protein
MGLFQVTVIYIARRDKEGFPGGVGRGGGGGKIVGVGH